MPFEYIPNTGAVRSSNRSMFSISITFHSDFHSQYTNFHSHSSEYVCPLTYIPVSISHLLLFFFLICHSDFDEMRCQIYLVCISSMTFGTEYLNQNSFSAVVFLLLIMFWFYASLVCCLVS